MTEDPYADEPKPSRHSYVWDDDYEAAHATSRSPKGDDRVATRRVISSYPLATLFVVMAVCAIVARVVSPAIRSVISGTFQWQLLVIVPVLVGSLFTVVGFFLGLMHHRRGRGALAGALVGGIAGMLLCPVVMAPVSSLGTLFVMSIAGSMVIGIIATIARLATNQRRLSSVASPLDPPSNIKLD